MWLDAAFSHLIECPICGSQMIVILMAVSLKWAHNSIFNVKYKLTTILLLQN